MYYHIKYLRSWIILGLFADFSMASREPDMQVTNSAGAAVKRGERGEQAQAMPPVFETLKSVAT